ncbi:MAG: hypothetical protein ACE5GM_06310 [bacterium]
MTDIYYQIEKIWGVSKELAPYVGIIVAIDRLDTIAYRLHELTRQMRIANQMKAHQINSERGINPPPKREPSDT